jgi:hypothetical protein
VGRGIALLFLDLGARRGGWSAPRPGRFTPGKDPVPIVQEPGWASGQVWTCAKNLAPPGFDPRTVQPVVSRIYIRIHVYIYIYNYSTVCVHLVCILKIYIVLILERKQYYRSKLCGEVVSSNFAHLSVEVKPLSDTNLYFQ